jgi:hypothetical protein
MPSKDPDVLENLWSHRMANDEDWLQFTLRNKKSELHPIPCSDIIPLSFGVHVLHVVIHTKRLLSDHSEKVLSNACMLPKLFFFKKIQTAVI